MAIKINFNICDNSSECSGISACETGALYWSQNDVNVLGEKGLLSVDNSKCVSCGKCVGEDGCSVGAIIFAETDEELQALTENIIVDVNQVRSLFVDRYGAEPIDETICISAHDLAATIESSHSGVTVVEFFADWSIQCLLTSIPIDSILRRIGALYETEDLRFYKCDISSQVDEASLLPALHVYQNGKLACKIEGYYTQESESILWEKLDKYLQ